MRPSALNVNNPHDGSKSMTTILYRLPEEKVVHELRCSRVEKIDSLQLLGQHKGYAFVPFDVKGSSPTLLYIPNEEHSWMTPNRFSTRHVEYTSDEPRRRQLYAAEFTRCLECLQQAEVDKIVLSRTLQLNMDDALTPDDRRNLFIVACHRYPHSYVALIDDANSAWLIATPEVLLEEKEGTLRTMALAATMSIEEGAHLPPTQWSAKNRKEQQIVAEYIGSRLNSLGIEFSSSAVHTKIAGQLVHLCTDFSMNLDDNIGRIIAALHPTPAVCGLPTERAHQLITAIESHDRSYYAGFSGPIHLDTSTHLFVTLRCMHIKDATAHLYAGGGLLADSEAESEWVETQRKLKTMLNVLQ